MGDLVPEHGRERGVVPGHRQDAGVDDDLAAGQAVGVGLVLAKQRHLPVERGLVAAGDRLDPLRDPLHLRRTRRRTRRSRARSCRSVFAYCWLPSCVCCSSLSATCCVRWVTGVVCLWVCSNRITPTTTAAIATAISGRATRKPSTRLPLMCRPSPSPGGVARRPGCHGPVDRPGVPYPDHDVASRPAASRHARARHTRRRWQEPVPSGRALRREAHAIWVHTQPGGPCSSTSCRLRSRGPARAARQSGDPLRGLGDARSRSRQLERRASSRCALVSDGRSRWRFTPRT